MLEILSYVIRRLGWAIPTIAGVILVVFSLSAIVPSDPAALLAGKAASSEMIQKIRERHGFNKPLYIQLFLYYKNIITGNLGESLYTHHEVSNDLLHKFPATMELALVSFVWAFLLAIPIGVISALKRNTWGDYVLRGVTISGISMASFWFAIVLQITFGWKLDLLPVHGRLTGFPPVHITGFYLIDSLLTWNLGALLDALKHICLPAVCLGFPVFATLVRFSRAGMLDEIGKEDVLYLVSMGLSYNKILYKYVLRKALPATIAQTGLAVAYLIGGNLVIELVFNWPGIGNYTVTSILSFDYNAVLGCAVWLSIAYISANLLADITLRILDPRKLSQ